jgi:TIR domain
MSNQIFVAYSHVDAAWREKIVKHLQVALYTAHCDLWDDTRIGAGEEWRQQIVAAVDRCVAAVLLVSVDSLTSEFILKEEVPRLLDRRKEGLPVVPVVVGHCAWKRVPWLESLQIRPRDGQPLADRADSDAALEQIVDELAARLSPAEPPQAQPLAAPRPPDSQHQALPTPGIANAPRGVLAPPAIQHNVIRNGVGCMDLHVSGTLEGAAGHSAQLVVRFFFPDGRMLIANVQEWTYRDSVGAVAAYTPPLLVTSPSFDLSGLFLTIPYYALNLVPTGMRTQYALTALAEVYVDGALALRSGPSPFSVWW